MIDRYGWCSRSHQQWTKFLDFVAYFLLPPIFSRFKCSFFLFNFECLPIAVFSALFHSSLAVRKPGKKKHREKNPKLEFKIPKYNSTGIPFSELVLRIWVVPPRGHLPPLVTQPLGHIRSRAPWRAHLWLTALMRKSYSDERKRIVFLQLFAIF